jgi:hypothetical protein
VHGTIDKFNPVICLKAFNKKAKLGADVMNKINDELMHL